MKKILFWLFIGFFVASPLLAQDTATQQQLDKLSGQIQDLLEAQSLQGKRIDALEKEIGDLRDKVNTPQVSDSASREDLKNLAQQVQALDQKRLDDRDLILKEIEKLGKVAASAPLPAPHKSKVNSDAPAASGDAPAALPAGPKSGYYYTIKDGDTLSLIIKAYRDSDQHVKVTKAQILAANPGLDPNKLYVGKKIFIPDANVK